MTKPSLAKHNLPVLIAVTSAALIVLVSLGFWQLQRRSEKQAFLGAITLAASQPPIEIWQDARTFQRVKMTGLFDEDRTVYVRVTSSEGLGVYVMTPLLQRAQQRLIYVNRGFVRTGIDGKPAAIETPKGPVTIIGFKREAEERGRFTVPDERKTRLFAVRDPAAFAELFDLPVGRSDDVASLYVETAYIEAQRQPGNAVPNGTSVDELLERIPDNHLHYAVTWFGIAATLLGVSFVLGRRMRRQS
jgi:surfeit locus 1 family protein